MRFMKPMALNSLSLKILLAYVAGMALSMALLVIAAVVVLQTNLLARMDMVNAVEALKDNVVFDRDGSPIGFDSRLDDRAWLYEGPQRETAYRILDDAGNVAVSSSASEAFWPPGDDLLRMTSRHFTFEHEGNTFYGATQPLQHEGRRWFLQFAASARFMSILDKVALPRMIVGITVFGIVFFMAFGLCAFITLRYTLKPLRDVSETAAAISPRSLNARLRTAAVPAEIAPLVDSFNRALERLERGYRVQQEFLGNAAHELKTPLALIRAQIELREDGKKDNDSLLSDVEYMTRQVQQLLLLAEASEANNYHFTTVRMQEVAQDAASYLQRMAEIADVHLAVRAVGDVKWRADRAACFTLLKNLLENAIQHAPAQTSVSVEIQGDTVTVRDRGPGVDAEQLPLLFERFWRAAHRRDHGAGLGLAICQEIAMTHGWQLTAEPAEPGLRFRLLNRP
ncbi:HAMP domain-containing protein [Halomonas daqingensis]|uniref:histidine kinase n=1 Tax=Billgrantia desiderata TaxID=52021 RepID=A0ABS9BA46_9GAMM|nr:ATP-binding protein [Halomonas desiderata]MCE8014207.1 HAMP domain-containing protein [Halomonas desiderata]MCE8030060.1 HAMP domain-containing protein [Halomonas desiderata]MCE8044438.1 HAMP domain-containing protein [Halomonas desiderata]MCE8049012.1 HAMP domain-containing protein [Halomonas desiderata]